MISNCAIICDMYYCYSIKQWTHLDEIYMGPHRKHQLSNKKESSKSDYPVERPEVANINKIGKIGNLKKINPLAVNIVAVLIILQVTAVLTQDNETLDMMLDHLMQNAGYPKPGDIPILNRKIFRGRRVHIHEHPYVVSVRRMTSHYLAAALLTKNLLITVAHPLIDVPIMELSAVVGENYSDRGSAMYTILLVIIHHDFDRYTLINDLAMLRLFEEMSYKGNVKPISLMPPYTLLDGETAFVTGWGRCDNMGTELCLDRSSKYYLDEKLDPMLRTVSFKIQTQNYYCDGYKRHEVHLRSGMLCTGGAREDDPVSPCLGVPGALMVVNARLTGILSWGFGCGYSYDLPLVYTNLLFYSGWIAYNIRESRSIRSHNLTELFKATRSAILSQWLIETRVITPKLFIRNDKTLEPLDIDYELVKLRGTLYDVRDFIKDGRFHEEKLAMYETIRSHMNKVQVLKYVPTMLSLPFLREEALEEIGLNKSDIFTTANVTSSTSDAEKVQVEEDNDDD